MADGFDVLASDHTEVKPMLAELDAPASAGLLKMAGPAVAAADMARDAASGRGE